MSSIALRATDIRDRLPQWLIGILADSSYLNDVDTAINSDPQAVDVWTVQAVGATNSTEYIVTVDGVEVSFTSDATATVLEIADGLREALNENPIVRGRFVSTDNGVDTITITGLIPGDVAVITDNHANLTTTHVTTADSADPIEFGRLIVSTSGEYDEGVALCAKAAAAKLTAQVDSMVVTFAAGELYGVSIAIDDEEYGVEVAADTDTDTTGAAIVAALNAMLPANTVLAAYTAGTDTISLTAEVAGKAFVTSRWLKSGTVARLTLVHTTSGPATDLNEYALGISLHTYDEMDVTIEGDDVVYPANAGVKYCRSGRVVVENSEAVTKGGKVYVELGVTADNGKFFAASSATRVRLKRASWERREHSSASDGMAILRLAAP